MKECVMSSKKYTSAELLQYISKFFRDNDQFPPAPTIAKHFGVANTSVVERLLRLEITGVITRNAVGKYKFSDRNRL